MKVGYQGNRLDQLDQTIANDPQMEYRFNQGVPNAVTDDMFAELRKHWSEEQIVEIVGVISLFGFLNRWNDTMATPLEDEPIAVGERYLKRGGWTAGKHRA